MKLTDTNINKFLNNPNKEFKIFELGFTKKEKEIFQKFKLPKVDSYGLAYSHYGNLKSMNDINDFLQILGNNSKKNINILEDKIKKIITTVLDGYMKELPSDYDAFFLGSGCGLHIDQKEIIPNKHIYQKNSSKCTDSYIISKNGAIKLNNFMKNEQSKYKINLPIDHWLNLAFKETNSNVYWCEPTIVKQGSENNIFKTTLRSK